MNSKGCILMMAGGTGGHVFPALSVAKELMAQGYTVEWLGTPRGIENELIPNASITLHHIDITGLRGKGLAGLLTAPWRIINAVWQALKIIKTIRPCAVVGFGGYATGPGGIAAKLTGIPVLIHEQNAIAGMTNKLLAPISNVAMQAFPNALKNALVVGNPVRTEVAAIPAPLTRYRIESKTPLKVLVVGGSLGATALNQLILDSMKLLSGHTVIELRHQVGKANYANMVAAYKEAKIDAEIIAFIDDIAASYAWADLVICRAGALTVAEISAAGAAAIFVPFPFAVDDHQTANAQYLAEHNAAIIYQQTDLSAEILAEQLAHFSVHREELLNIACNARQQAITTATTVVTEKIKRFCRG